MNVKKKLSKLRSQKKIAFSKNLMTFIRQAAEIDLSPKRNERTYFTKHKGSSF